MTKTTTEKLQRTTKNKEKLCKTTKNIQKLPHQKHQNNFIPSFTGF